MLSFLPFRTLGLSSPTPETVPTPAGGAAPLSAAANPSSADLSTPPEFEIPYDFVTELPKSDGQVRWENFVQKNKQNPFIGLGTAATCYALYGAIRSMRAGNQKQMQRFFRLRVAAQAFAIVAVVAGGVLYEGAHPVKSLMSIPANAREGFERNAQKAEAMQEALAKPTSPQSLELAAPPTLTPKRSFQDHAADEAAKQEQQRALTAEDRMRQHSKLEEEASGNREDRRNRFKLA